MTTISQLREIADHVRSLPNKNAKAAFLDNQPREVLNFLSGNVQKDGVGKAIAEEIPKGIVSESTMESVTDVFKYASGLSGRNDKIGSMQWLILSPTDRSFVLTALYGSLKLGITVPVPDPVFGDTFRPQLCGTGIEIDPMRYIIEEKFDGHRCIGINDDGKVKLYTRSGKPLVAEAITDELADAIPPGFVVDGELVAESGEFADLKRHSDEVEYKVFDMPFFEHNSITDLTLFGRRTILEECLHETERIQISPILHLTSMRDIDQWIERNNAEGIIAKEPDSFYSYGGRKDWIKVKPWLDISGWVVGWTPGEGKRAGILGAVEFHPDGFENTTLVGSGFTDEGLLKMKELLKSEKRVRITVKYQNLTTDRKLRFPTFLRVDEVI